MTQVEQISEDFRRFKDIGSPNGSNTSLCILGSIRISRFIHLGHALWLLKPNDANECPPRPWMLMNPCSSTQLIIPMSLLDASRMLRFEPKINSKMSRMLKNVKLMHQDIEKRKAFGLNEGHSKCKHDKNALGSSTQKKLAPNQKKKQLVVDPVNDYSSDDDDPPCSTEDVAVVMSGYVITDTMLPDLT